MQIKNLYGEKHRTQQTNDWLMLSKLLEYTNESQVRAVVFRGRNGADGTV